MEALHGPKLVLEPGSLVDRAQEIELDGEEIIIGRDPAADLVIPSPMISRRHARVYPEGGGYMIQDLGSTNKTFLNGQPVDAPRPLASGDEIQIGSAVRLTFFAPPPAAPETVDMDVAVDATAGAPGGADVHDAATEERGAAGRPARVDATVADVSASSTGGGRTMIASDLPAAELAQPPLLIVTVANQDPQTIRLTQDRLRLGRAPDNDIVIPSPIVSGHHARLWRTAQGYVLHMEGKATNPIYYNGAPVTADQPLHDGDILRIGSRDPGVMVTIAYQSTAEAALARLTRSIVFGAQDQLQIGRDPSNDVVLDAPIVSRFHAIVERIGQRFRVRDLHSANGTFVNDQHITEDTWLKPGDTIRVGPYRFILGQDQLARIDETDGLRVQVIGLNKWVRKDLNLLKDISLIFEPRQFVVVVGQSGGGKSTLVDAIAGYRPATNGRVLVNGIDIYRHFNAIRNEIGFVPQRDIIHMELTVYQALDYAAQLRMPADTTPEERHRRIMEVLDDLDLTHRKDVQISGLSGGQQKRVSIGVELLTKPGLFFLDEPTSGLDPGAETSLMHLMRRLADQGRTIVLITHATKNVVLADRVVFLARGGHLAWFGPPDEALRYFDRFRSERDRRAREMEFDEIYAILDDPSRGKPEDWAARYRESPYYEQYVVEPLAASGQMVAAPAAMDAAEAATMPKPAKPAFRRPVSAARQFRILSARNIKSISRDRASLILMLVVAPALAMVDVGMAFIIGHDPLNYQTGDMGNVITSLFQPGMFAILVGALAMMREFVKESDIFKRERLVNLKLLPYVGSKLWVAAILAVYQAAVYSVVHYLAFKMPPGVANFLVYYVTMFMGTLVGMTIGLLASAIAPNGNAAPLIAALFIIPEVVLGGGLFPVQGPITYVSAARWTFQGLMSMSGAGSDVARDPCWQLPKDVRDKLSEADKEARGCPCMGLNALNQNSCNFPGLGQYYDPAVSQPQPVAPAPIGDAPQQPTLPPRPTEPANPNDQQAVAKYLNDLNAYQTQVDQINATYQAQAKDYQARADQFKADSTAYQKALSDWTVKRNAAVSGAESTLSRFQKDYGWTFVDKHDNKAYWLRIGSTWGAMVVMIVVLLGAIMGSMARKA